MSISDLVTRACLFAAERHQGQTRKGITQRPYVTHLEQVVSIVSDLGGDEQTIAAAWLHDVVEDCPPTSIADIEHLFGRDVALLVAEVTDDKSLPKATRKELQVKNAPKKSDRAALIKWADKIVNLYDLFEAPPQHWPRERCLAYVEWARAVVSGLSYQPQMAITLFDEIYTKAYGLYSKEN